MQLCFYLYQSFTMLHNGAVQTVEINHLATLQCSDNNTLTEIKAGMMFSVIKYVSSHCKLSLMP